MEPKHSLAFILDRERERGSLARYYEPTENEDASASPPPVSRASAVAVGRSGFDRISSSTETYRTRHDAVFYREEDYIDVPVARQRTPSFPYHFPYQYYVDEQTRSTHSVVDVLSSPSSQTRFAQPPISAPAILQTAPYDSPSSSSSAAQPRPRRQPMTAEEKRAARKCSVDGCKNYTIDRGLCFRHGGGKTCAVEGCDRSAKARGLCWRHGGSVQCTVDGCDRGAKSKGLCWSHGGGTKCSVSGCDKTIISKGLCWTHGGGKRCMFEGCKRPASESKHNFCNHHHAALRDGNTIYEV